MLAKRLILNTRQAIGDFDRYLQTVPMFEFVTEHCVWGLFPYLIDRNNCRADVGDYITELLEDYQSSVEAKTIDAMYEQLEEVARAIWEEMVTWGAYQDGVNLYDLTMFMCYDLVLDLNQELVEQMEDDHRANLIHQETRLRAAELNKSQMAFEFGW